MTTYGYALPNPEKAGRLAIWFTGGSIEVINPDDSERWLKVFGSEKLPKRKIKEKARVLGAQVMMGADVSDKMEEDGTISYHLNRPFGGHNKAYVDVVYLDETLRIVRSSSGVVHIFARVPSFPDE
jgi:hypothetical protein